MLKNKNIFFQKAWLKLIALLLIVQLIKKKKEVYFTLKILISKGFYKKKSKGSLFWSNEAKSHAETVGF